MNPDLMISISLSVPQVPPISDPIEAVKFRMEQLGYTQSDLAEVVGLKSRASEILNRKRRLNLEMIRKLHAALGIPTNVLIQSY